MQSAGLNLHKHILFSASDYKLYQTVNILSLGERLRNEEGKGREPNVHYVGNLLFQKEWQRYAIM